MPGLSTSAPYDKMGQAGSPVGDVRSMVPRAGGQLIGGDEGLGFRTVDEGVEQTAHPPGRAMHGARHGMLEEAVAYISSASSSASLSPNFSSCRR